MGEPTDDHDRKIAAIVRTLQNTINELDASGLDIESAHISLAVDQLKMRLSNYPDDTESRRPPLSR